MTGSRSGTRANSPDAVLAEVADAVRLQEGSAGVRSVLRVIRRLAPASTKEVSRNTGLPVPIVAAVGNELRRRGLLTEQRPSRLTPAGTALVVDLGMDLSLDVTCRECDGRELVIPSVLSEAVERLSVLMAEGPEADMSLDQSRCTPETKVRRVLALLRAGVLPGGALLLVGDDDIVSVAIAVVGDVLGFPLVERLAVVDISPEILGHIRDVSAKFTIQVDTVAHDLRQPLPDSLRAQFDAAMTDPPYTPEGARLFLSRAVEGLRPGPARSVFFSFGSKGPDEMLEVQREIIDLGLVTNGFIRNFNEYEGSGILGGTGFMQHLLTTGSTISSLSGDYQGPLYTREKRSRQREYECVSCGARIPVGAGARWTSVGALRADGCPNCGGGPFKPRQLLGEAVQVSERVAPAQQASSIPESMPHSVAQQFALPETRDGVDKTAAFFVTRAADERDLDAIGEFEAEIARISFGSTAVDNPQTHRERLAKAMRKSRAGMFVACRPDDDTAVGWLWMSINQNAMTGDHYANFRSLAVAPIEQRTEVAELLLTTGLDFAVEQEVTEVVGKVHVGNVPMRTLYRKFGFEAAHMTMRLSLPKGIIR